MSLDETQGHRKTDVHKEGKKKNNSVKTYTGSSSILLNKYHRVILCLWKKKKENSL